MSERFDDFSDTPSHEQAERQRLARETKPEWSILKGFASDFAGKVFAGHKFQWAPEPSTTVELLILNNVAAIFSHSERNGIVTNCSVRFDRRPPELRMFLGKKSEISPKEWSLMPATEGEAVLWFVPELGEIHSSMELADAIAKELGEHHKRYELRYGHWPAA